MKLRGNSTVHLIDRYVGIPLVAILGGLRRKRRLPSRIGTIGILKGAAIGDTVLLSGVIADLRKAFPKAKIVVFAGDTNYEMACLLEGVNQVVKIPTSNVLRALQAIRSVSLDVVLDFAQWSRAEALLAMGSKAKYKIGFKTTGQYRHAGFDATVEHSSKKHELENYRNLVRPLGISATQPLSLKVRKSLGTAALPFAVCHLWPGGRRSELKQWPLERWMRLMGELVGWGLPIVLTGGPTDSAANDKIITELPDHLRGFVRNVAGISLSETVETLSRACLTISVNTGIMHIAAALGVPVIGMQGPTSSKRWGPVGSNAIAVDSSLPCCGYLNLGSEYPPDPPPCMEGISYDSVHAACLRLLKANKLVRSEESTVTLEKT